MNPPLPEPVMPPRLMVEPKGINGALYTEAQLLAYRAEVIEMCANLSPNELDVCASYKPARVWQIYSEALRNLI